MRQQDIPLAALDKYDRCPRLYGGCGADWEMLQRMLANPRKRREAQFLIQETTRGACSLCVQRWREVLADEDKAKARSGDGGEHTFGYPQELEEG